MAQDYKLQNTERVSFSQKNANDKKWYKDKADELDSEHTDLHVSYGGISEYRKMKVNYDLFNNKLNLKDFTYVCQPFGSEVGELPAKMINRDISSGKIKAMLGMEMKRPFPWNVIATNPEATTRKEQEEFGRIRDWVVSEIVRPIRQEAELKAQQEAQGRELTPEEQERIQQQVEEEIQAKTPPETRKYMQREHQDPAEAMSQQLLQYLLQKEDMKTKFNNMYKHSLLSSKGIMYIGILNGEPVAWNINSMRYTYDRSPDLECLEDAERGSCEYRMTPSQVVRYFGKELTEAEIDKLYNGKPSATIYDRVERWLEDDNDTSTIFNLDEDYSNTIRVLHCVWKSLREIFFLTYLDDDGEEQMMIVDENYKFNPEHGDISIESEWIPEAYETWKIEGDIYVNMRPIPGQFKDLDNLYHCKLPYYGYIYDNMNSEETSLMDRLKVFQYYYNIVMYRLELLLASDKGKKVLMNIGSIPTSAGIDIKKWQYFMESTPFMWYDPQEEGNTYADANTVAKVIDLSVVSDIQKYIEVAEYLRNQAGRSVGITDQVEGQIGANESVGNTRQNLVQSSHVLEWYFDVHNRAKKNILQALIETAKVAYRGSKPRKLSYFLDDMSQAFFELDMDLLDNSTIGIFVTNSSDAEEVKDVVRQLAHAALQTEKAQLSDVISMIRNKNIVEMEETIKAAEETAYERQQASEQQAIKAKADSEEKARQFLRETWKHEADMVILKEEEKRKTEVIKGALVGASFNPDQDADNDGMNDFVEIAKHGLNAEIQAQKGALEREKFEHQKEVDNKKLVNEEKKIKIAQTKSTQKNT